nr:MAG TPA: hypothetical protein [Caudoviricetes sp.]
MTPVTARRRARRAAEPPPEGVGPPGQARWRAGPDSADLPALVHKDRER